MPLGLYSLLERLVARVVNFVTGKPVKTGKTVLLVYW